MAGSKKKRLLGMDPGLMCAITPGTLGINDAANPDTPDWFLGDTPGSLGCNDHADPQLLSKFHLIKDHFRHGPPLAPAPDLSNVPTKDLTEYVPEVVGKFRENIVWASGKTGLNPGFLASVLLSEKDRPHYYTCAAGTVLHDVDCVKVCPKDAPGVCSFAIGTDYYKKEKNRIDEIVPAASEVKTDVITGGTSINEKGHAVKNIHFRSGRDAVLGVAVYLKYGEYLVRQQVRIFDAEPIAVQWGLIRLAMNPGIGDAKTRIAKVLHGRDMFVHGVIHRSGKKADTGMTRIVAIGIYLSENVFGISPM